MSKRIKPRTNKDLGNNNNVNWQHPADPTPHLYPGLPITGNNNAGKHSGTWIPSDVPGVYNWTGKQHGGPPVEWSWGMNCEDGANSFSADCSYGPAGPGNPCTDHWDGEQTSCRKLNCPDCPGKAHFHVY